MSITNNTPFHSFATKSEVLSKLSKSENLADLTNTQTAVENLQLSNIRKQLGSNLTYYVRTDGNDSNTGLSDSAGGAFLTIQRAVDVVASLDLAIYDVTIQVADGTYTQGVSLKTLIGAGQVTIRGNPSTPSNVLISTTSANCMDANNIVGRWKLAGLKLTATTSGYLISAEGVTTTLTFENIDFGSAPAIQVYVAYGALVRASGNFTFSAGSLYAFYLNAGAQFLTASTTVTVSNSPTYVSAFCRVEVLSQATFYSVTFSGSATGTRYQVVSNSVLNTWGGGADFLPGDTAGSTSTGGVYL